MSSVEAGGDEIVFGEEEHWDFDVDTSDRKRK